ncbi:MAG TPA: nucleoside deaminase [Terricaulis sp.]|nr:nucleoside deaminase [Terricaulis sp.]
MGHALALAARAAEAGEAPIGALIVDEAGAVIAEGANAPIALNDPTAHAEIIAIRRAAEALGNYRLKPGLTLYVTLEPCAMCAGAISAARIARVVYAAPDAKGGAIAHGPRYFEQPTCHWRPSVSAGLRSDESAEMLRAFFKARRS